MHIAILMTNTDVSAFADQHPRDGEKFSTLLNEVRPDWTFTSYDVKDGVFPQNGDAFDAVIVTGSPASVHDGAPWIDTLMVLLDDLHARRVPMYGACFGHQAIAAALGGTVGKNPDGWALGTIEATLTDRAGPISLYAAHKEQVTKLPEGAEIIARAPACPIAGFRLGAHIMTTQYHPEMTPEFISALIDEMAQSEPADVIDRARKSLNTQANRTEIAEIMARFFEQGHANGAACR